ncbi:uroporphyrin-III C/tetrapyrrole methyltransferase [Spiribacter salinus M19-40]|jgi:16S rRNA (cytidine1402-2'-O)-methyltransferase|uniref:Ribosomal RNA small subunit methyltransferase I n=1 Tax=Spiribacter salinus M19-40 TaxID=1260251 RepID=R4V916_9GAMM|nr:16S rRNA (cytidine(1402)-2'-O)-methyltransferase [Spiribacter salinus]AGM41470.1 uroporphyrin-III C/tetrapyrrole methyltransferase [Spiribacter salinus M19-40]
MVSIEPGRLYVVATPIGNLGDLSARARETLAGVDAIAAEDTRHTARLLGHLGLKQPLISLHEHNENERVAMLRQRLDSGSAIALVSDAGTPLISDPGYRLVRALREAGREVLAVPGPSSIVAALSVAGLPTDRFSYEGFLPARPASRRKRLTALAGLEHTLVVLESGRRLEAALADMVEAFGPEREAAICRELTKRFETTRLDTLAALVDWVAADPHRLKGEFVILIGGAPASSAEQAGLPPVEVMLQLLRQEGLGAKAAARIAAQLTGGSTNQIYTLAVQADKP